jgi:hypothetical protein
MVNFLKAFDEVPWLKPVILAQEGGHQEDQDPKPAQAKSS